MLILHRKRSEVIQVGPDIKITVIQTARGSCKIGIEAPEHVRVLRGELSHAPLSLKDFIHARRHA